MPAPIINTNPTSRQVVLIFTDQPDGTVGVNQQVFPPVEPRIIETGEPVTGALAMLSVALNALQQHGRPAGN